MKIISLNYSDTVGGAAKAAYRLHRALLLQNIHSRLFVNQKLKDDWTVIGPNGFINKFWQIYKGILLNKFVQHFLKRNLRSLQSLAIIPSGYSKFINSSDADIVHLHWINFETISIKEISQINKPIVWTLHDMWPFCGSEHLSSNEERWTIGYNSKNKPHNEEGIDLNRWTWARKKKYWKNQMHIVAPSNWLGRCAAKSNLFKNFPVHVIPNPIDTKAWQAVDKKLARELLNLPQGKSLIIFGAQGGVSDKNKGFDLLVQSLDSLPLSCEIELVIFGQSEPEKKLNLKLKTHFLGILQDEKTLNLALSSADILVIPSRIENMPNVVLEAFASGTPAIGYKTAGIPDIIEDGVNGYLVEPFKIDDFANAISKALSDKDILATLSRNARNTAVANYSNDMIGEKYKNLYAKILETHLSIK